ncbi:hypothetical protein FLW53_28495 [Microbispora sp. SCL1-1]|uniref:hypothetical protein n=1 Tax=unclassified Microbispora TaxID=2614687 RepID=UPI00115BF426|nr:MULTISPECIES: hypothetical protein [unclassified Microbispora]NJP28070.1 hypothetical protein [Microbispora sp. CL1-1]TQS09429.1 hypothetical protein FLW53_28495 [Microbispora sp. SCL1-1]
MPDTPDTSTPDERPRSVEEMRQWLRDFQKAQRIVRLAQGKGRPRTRAEMDVWIRGARNRLGIADEQTGEGDASSVAAAAPRPQPTKPGRPLRRPPATPRVTDETPDGT